MQFLFYLAIVLLFLLGCAGDKITPMQGPLILPENEAFTHFEGNSSEKVEMSFQTLFPNEVLSSIVDQALRENRDWKVTLGKIDLARAEAERAISGGEPSLSSSFSYREGEEKRRETFFRKDDVAPWRAGAQSTWELDLWGKWKALRKSSENEVESTRHAVEASKIMLIHEVALAWISYCRYKEESELLAESIRLALRTESLIQRKVDAGIETNSTLLSQKLNFNTLNIEKKHAENMMISHQLRLQGLLGSPLDDAPLYVPLTTLNDPALPRFVPSSVISNRPDVQAIEKKIESKLNLHESARMNLLPSFGLRFSGFAMSHNLGESFGEWQTQVGPRFDIPVWVPERKAYLKTLRKQYDQLILQWEALILRVIEEIESSTRSFFIVSSELELTKANLAHAQAIRSYSEEKFSSGIISEIEFFKDQNLLIAHRRVYLKSKHHFLKNFLIVCKSLGIPWNSN